MARAYRPTHNQRMRQARALKLAARRGELLPIRRPTRREEV